MTLGLDSFLIALAFLLPGFLTSSLIAARTPAMGRRPSAFEETLGSLLRSVYIHLLVAPVIVTITFIFIRKDTILLSRISNEGLQAFYDLRPLEASFILFIWLAVAFIVAFIFGYKWDPLESFFRRLVKKTGTLTEDPFYDLYKQVIERRKNGDTCQLWIQARLKNGCMYQGEFVFMGYKHENKERELMLKNVDFFPHQVTNEISSRQLYDFVFLNLANCDSLDVLFSNADPSLSTDEIYNEGSPKSGRLG